MDPFVLLAYASLAASRALLQRLLACLNLSFDSEDVSVWCKWKKWYPWIMAAAQASENHGDEWGLTWYFVRDVFIKSFLNPHLKNLLAAAEAPSLIIYSLGTSPKLSQRPSQSARE